MTAQPTAPGESLRQIPARDEEQARGWAGALVWRGYAERDEIVLALSERSERSSSSKAWGEGIEDEDENDDADDPREEDAE